MRTPLSLALNDTVSRIPTSLNLISTDPRVVTYINMATAELLTLGHWWGTKPKYTVSVKQQIFTQPPQFANMERVAVCQAPVNLRNDWYEFSSQGPGVSNDPSANMRNSNLSGQAQFRGIFCVFNDIAGTNSKLRVQCDVVDDVGTTVLLLGYDANGNWIRTKVGGVWQDGETVALAQSPGTISVNTFSKITDIQKPVTNGQIWLYEQDGVTNPLIGNYQYWETNPAYTRYLLPIIDGTTTQIDFIGKLTFRPVTNPTDYLLIGNLEAMRKATMSKKAEEEGDYTAASLLMNGGTDKKSGIAIRGAVQILDAELQHYRGDGEVPTMEIVTAYGMEGVPALI